MTTHRDARLPTLNVPACVSGSSEVSEEAHTVDVGHVHVLAEPSGSCAPGCPHPDHHTEETR